MGIDTIFVTLLYITKKLLKKIRFSIMAALICIYKNLPKVVKVTTRLNIFRDPMGSQINQNTLDFREFIGYKFYNWTIWGTPAAYGSGMAIVIYTPCLYGDIP